MRHRRRRGAVAGDDDELHVPLLEEGADLAREATYLRERPRPIREPGVVTEVDEILVRERDEAFVEDGQAAHARVEHPDGPRIHGG